MTRRTRGAFPAAYPNLWRDNVLSPRPARVPGALWRLKLAAEDIDVPLRLVRLHVTASRQWTRRLDPSLPSHCVYTRAGASRQHHVYVFGPRITPECAGPLGDPVASRDLATFWGDSGLGLPPATSPAAHSALWRLYVLAVRYGLDALRLERCAPSELGQAKLDEGWHTIRATSRGSLAARVVSPVASPAPTLSVVQTPPAIKSRRRRK